MTARRLLAATGLLLAVAFGLMVNRVAASRSARLLPEYERLPEFALTDQRGRPVGLADLRGAVWVADFIFTRCAGQCPMMTARMAALQRRFASAPQLQLVSITVDPSHDTPEALAAYAAHAGAGHHWRFLTGEAAAVTALARDGFHLGISPDGTVEEPITHSVRLVLVDRQGRVRGYYEAVEAEAMRSLERDIRRLLGQG